ncbi:MAG TPA: DNA polymerase III subunit beta [Thermoleophilia bacterium]|nr:DNA polymerase III subunit beta [Thermoleophilia bacterium]
MELRIPVVELSRALSAAQGAVQRKNTMPILSHVLVNAVAGTDGAGRLTIAATDLDIGVRSEHPCEVLTAGAVTIPARALADMVRELPGPDVSLKRLPNQHVEVKSGRTRARLLALSADEFPPLPPYHEASFVALDTALLVDMVDKTLYASSQDETRYNLNGVLFEPPQQAGGPLTMVATDGHRLVRVERTVDGVESFGIKAPVILPRKGLAELRRILGNDLDGKLELGFKDNHAVVRRATTVLGMRLVDGQFPDYKQVIPKLADKIVRIARQDLTATLRRVTVLAQDRMQPVKLTLAKDQLVVTCSNPDAGEISDDVPVEYAGQAIEVAFNGRYLLEALTSLDDKNVLLKLIDNLSPGVVVGVDEPRHLCVVMPMRL